MRAYELQRIAQQLGDRAKPPLRIRQLRAHAEAGRSEHALLEHLRGRIRLGVSLRGMAGEAVGEGYQRRCLIDRALRVERADLDGAEPWVGPKLPPEPGVVGNV